MIYDEETFYINMEQIITIDETKYQGDEELERIINRLAAAASDPKVRQDMNVEEEYFQAIENRDTAIMMRDEKIKEQDSMITEQSNQIAEQSNQIAEQRNALLLSAKALKASGYTEEQISSMTNLSVDEIRCI